jgi:multidrug resistance efflux pump
MQQPRIRGKWVLFATAVILLAIAAGAVSVVWRERFKPKPKPQPAASVTIFSGSEISLSGKVQALHVVTVPAPIDGKIEMFHVDDGQEVSQGQLLAQIASESLNAAQEAAAHELEQIQSRVNTLESSIIAARLEASRAAANASRANTEFDRADKAYQRQKTLLSAGATPKLAYEKAEKEYLTARSEADTLAAVAKQAEDRVGAMKADLDGARKTLDEKTEALDNVKGELAAGEVRSPVDGIIVGRRGDAGDSVDRSMKDFFQIATDLNLLAVMVEPQPAVLARIRPGQGALITVAEVPNENLSGVVKTAADGKVTVEFTSPTSLIRPGVSAQVTIKLT